MMLGILFGLLILKLFLLYLSKLFYMNLIEFYFLVKVMLLIIVLFMILFLIIGLMSLKLLSKKSILEFLVGIKKFKKEIKFLKLFGIIGVICFILGYVMILFGNKLKINGGMYIIVLLIILGIFLFFF